MLSPSCLARCNHSAIPRHRSKYQQWRRSVGDHYVVLDGPIVIGDADEIEAANLAGYTLDALRLNSEGGNVWEALQMAIMIRSVRNMATMARHRSRAHPYALPDPAPLRADGPGLIAARHPWQDVRREQKWWVADVRDLVVPWYGEIFWVSVLVARSRIVHSECAAERRGGGNQDGGSAQHHDLRIGQGGGKAYRRSCSLANRFIDYRKFSCMRKSRMWRGFMPPPDGTQPWRRGRCRAVVRGRPSVRFPGLEAGPQTDGHSLVVLCGLWVIDLSRDLRRPAVRPEMRRVPRTLSKSLPKSNDGAPSVKDANGWNHEIDRKRNSTDRRAIPARSPT